jgi:hypothetical protein
MTRKNFLSCSVEFPLLRHIYGIYEQLYLEFVLYEYFLIRTPEYRADNLSNHPELPKILPDNKTRRSCVDIYSPNREKKNILLDLVTFRHIHHGRLVLFSTIKEIEV